MIRREAGFALVVALSAAILLGLLAGLATGVGRPYPGFFFGVDYRIFPVEAAARAAGLAHGDRIVSVDGAAPLTLMAEVRGGRTPIRYEVERAGRRFQVELSVMARRPIDGGRREDG
jgi:hypothetical protein